MSRVLYYATRKVAGAAVSISTGLTGGHVPVERGSTYYHIRGDLDEEGYEELCQDTALELEAISYCQMELSTIGKSLQSVRTLLVTNFDENEQKKRLINHDFLMLKLQPGAPDKPAIYIMAEKVAAGEDGSKAGIHISIPEGGENMERKCCLRRIECRSQIGLLDLTAILKKQSPDYDLINDNCWDYARNTTKFLLEECILRKSGACEDQKRLQKELKNLDANLVNQHFVNTGERIVKYAVNTGERIEKYAKSHVLDKLKFS